MPEPRRDAPVAATGRDSGIKPFGKAVIRRLFARRNESLFMRGIARTSIRDARLSRDWRRARG